MDYKLELDEKGSCSFETKAGKVFITKETLEGNIKLNLTFRYYETNTYLDFGFAFYEPNVYKLMDFKQIYEVLIKVAVFKKVSELEEDLLEIRLSNCTNLSYTGFLDKE